MSQQNITTLQAAINNQLADNTSGDISAADVRDNLINMTDSLLFNSGSQGITGSLTATSFIGSLQGTASYATQALSASWAPSTGGSTFPYNGAAQITGSLSVSGSLTQQGGNINLGVSDSLGNRNIKFDTLGQNEIVLLAANDGPSILKSKQIQLNGANGISVISDTTTTIISNQTILSGSVLFEKAITSSLQGTASYATTATTASYVAGGNVDGTVGFASYADGLYVSYITGAPSGNYPLLFNFPDQTATYTGAYNDLNRLSYNPVTKRLTLSGSQVVTGSIISTGGFTGSLQGTASLSEATIGAGLYGGEIQFKGGTGPGSPEGKNTYSSAFIWDNAYAGLLIADPNTTFTQNGGNYYLQVGTGVVSQGDYSVSFGSSSYANGEGSFAQGKGVTANGIYSHTEGQNTLASANYSHAEGFYTTSSGNYSHAEGSGSIALGIASHAEGQFTIASGSYQHVEGRFNTQGDTTSLMIVGNGTSNAARQDAFKVRMSGSIVLPTTQSAAPSWTGADGEMVFATVTGNHFFYVWMAGQWRSGSLS